MLRIDVGVHTRVSAPLGARSAARHAGTFLAQLSLAASLAASTAVLGIPLGVDTRIVTHPDGSAANRILRTRIALIAATVAATAPVGLIRARIRLVRRTNGIVPAPGAGDH